MPEYLAPGVFVEEVSFRAKSIEGVETSTAGFVGPCAYGPVTGDAPLVTSLLEFERLFGPALPLQHAAAPGDAGPSSTPGLWPAVRAFFAEGGLRLHVARVFVPGVPGVPGAQSDGRARVSVNAAGLLVQWAARHPGRLGNGRLQWRLSLGAELLVGAASPGLRPGDVVLVQGPGWVAGAGLLGGCARLQQDAAGAWRLQGVATPPEGLPLSVATSLRPLRLDLGLQSAAGPDLGQLSALSLGELAARTSPESGDAPVCLLQAQGLVASDGLAWLRWLLAQGLPANPTLADLVAGLPLEMTLSGGHDGQRPGPTDHAGSAEPRSGLHRLAGTPSLDAISQVAAPVAMLGSPRAADEALPLALALVAHAEAQRYRLALIDPPPRADVTALRAFRTGLNSSRAALYAPWVEVPALAANEPTLRLPPSALMAGICARTDVQRGVHKAPANEGLQSVLALESNFDTGQQELLNAEGINLLRRFEGRGLRVWGARTLSHDPEWRYVPVRRLFNYLERSIDLGTQWAVFEPNGEPLWAQVRQAVEDFLFNQWRNGALLGSKPEEAYFVRCDRTTMTQGDLDAGRLIVLVGVAVVKPAEFVIFRVGQFTAQAVS